MASNNSSLDLGTFASALSAHFLERAEKYEKALTGIDLMLNKKMDKDLLFQKACIFRYGLQNDISAEAVFSDFLGRYSQDGLAVIARAELEILGLPPQPKEIHGEEKSIEIPSAFNLSQNYPNPFNPETEIVFSLPEATTVTLTVYNILGQVVAVLLDSDLEAGYHTVTWNGQNFSSGVYFFQFIAGEFTDTKRILLLT